MTKLWKYTHTDELYHKAGFKYIDKIFKNGRWQYIYDQASGAATNAFNNAKRVATGAYNSAANAVANARTDIRRKRVVNAVSRDTNQMSKTVKRGIKREAGEDLRSKAETFTKKALASGKKVSKKALDAVSPYTGHVITKTKWAAEDTKKGIQRTSKAVKEIGKEVYKRGKNKVADWAGADEKKKMQNAANKYAQASIGKNEATREVDNRLNYGYANINNKEKIDKAVDDANKAYNRYEKSVDDKKTAKRDYDLAKSAYDKTLLGRVENGTQQVEKYLKKIKKKKRKG